MGGTCSRVDEQPRAPPVSPKPIYRGGLSVDIPCETAVAGSPALSQGSIPSSSSPTSHPSMYQRRVFPAELREEWLEVLSVDDCSRRSARASRLLAARPEVVRGSPWWWTDDTGSLLHVAAERGDASLLRVILDAGAPDLPLALDADGQAALHVAVANGHLDAARVLVEVAAAQSGGCTALTLPDKYRMTPFHLACENGDVAMASFLLEQLALLPGLSTQEVAELRRGSANFLAQRGQHARVVALLDSVRSRLSEVSFLTQRSRDSWVSAISPPRTPGGDSLNSSMGGSFHSRWGSSLPTIVSGRNSSQRPRSDASDGDHNSASPSPVPAAACLSLSLDGTAPPLLPALPPTAEALSRLEEETTRPARRLAFR
ncbi:hypothetical protein EMIHUDRAFT_456746 [Emiliania huxleyi CCMP1516]|uniref:Uncharacterized protein n=2 Tax=Emiliania huxleyi TaxID=2903 RepID=A0A0D3K1J3_EMIH1|nr:hypothetical protein EMIHUDRAFT_456746 [Emiliania huxleyi CCMP1516]EOD29628.1 hypothetical protein EMIHUDRAFT_456746 [Emiliania huxleyi CCMP1516]|eukprot:XP_005782057.1 hypothetical protein EMIHUDRAFT_456746 [Emiliania huxleyi CCMP1516]